jgi:uncharacterized membrane protein
MDEHFAHLDHPHATLPRVRTVNPARPWRWLKLGWQDMAANPFPSLAYGAFFALAGVLILGYASRLPYLFSAALSGFLLVGPVAAAGLYEISRQRDHGRSCSLRESLQGLRGHRHRLIYFGLMLAAVLLLWERLSSLLFGVFYPIEAPSLLTALSDILFSGLYTHFAVAFVLIGGVLAALVFAVSAVAIPMLLDRGVDIATAMHTSARAVAHNLGAMALWAGLIVAAMAIGFASLMFGMVILLPLVGHATWHAYRDLVV